MQINNYINQKTEEAQYTLEATGLVMPHKSKGYKGRVVDLGVRSIKDSKISSHNTTVKDVSEKVMRGVPITDSKGIAVKLDLTYEQVKHLNPQFAKQRLDDTERRGEGMVKAAQKERSFFTTN